MNLIENDYSETPSKLTRTNLLNAIDAKILSEHTLYERNPKENNEMSRLDINFYFHYIDQNQIVQTYWTLIR